MAPKLGILAGGGMLPRQLAETCLKTGREIFLIAFTGHTEPDAVEGLPHAWARLGAAAKVLDRLHREGVQDLCLIGPIRRPSLRELMPDWRAARFLARVGFTRLGDDALLQSVRDLLQGEGFRLVGAHELLEDLLAKPGLLTRAAPDDAARDDIALGLRAARMIGTLDIGQGAVVQQGVVLALEAIEGTDRMLERCAGLRRAGPGGVLVKARKPQQDDRLDLPTIGVRTVELASAAGLRGIAVEAGGALVVDAPSVAEAANRLGLFVIGLEAEP
ncbi:MAG TPA: UDP-2,3-diacylglucosamine diphosphatase LpxI [Alphaproteobacteria bacterium]|nr:UDP-2,3-diacylglucosamine diphosphatase LpxI [Alphaproteobacteria bacterium]